MRGVQGQIKAKSGTLTYVALNLDLDRQLFPFATPEQAREHIVEGLETFPETLLMLFDGRNQGKLIIKV